MSINISCCRGGRISFITYHDNAGYRLSVSHLPWGKKDFSVKRYRLTKTEDLQLVEEKSETGDSYHLSSALPPDGVELIVAIESE
jgi:hypothetical protein